MKPSIITVGLAPTWDEILTFDQGINWGDHPQVSSRMTMPGGKAFNISKGLDAQGVSSIASGLWGAQDIKVFKQYITKNHPHIKSNMLGVTGATRTNTTIVDQRHGREMHLRNKSFLISKASLDALIPLLTPRKVKNKTIAFGGAMGEKKYYSAQYKLIKHCATHGGRLVLDTSGDALNYHVAKGLLWLIKPNLLELEQLVGHKIKKQRPAIVKAVTPLLHKVPNILVSLGKQGAMFIHKEGVIHAQCQIEKLEVVNTVGGGDYLLAGFLSKFIETKQFDLALANGIKMATLRCQGVQGTVSKGKLSKIPVKVTQIK